MLKVINVVGARPNFMKVAPIVRAMRRRGAEFEPLVAHTGQHYDARMSDAFFRDLELPEPDVHLGVGAGSHAQQTAAVMQRFEPIVVAEKPDWVVVVGDVNSTLACALVAVKLGVKVAHVEAGLRSRDRRMPEEINRLLTDQAADLLLTPSADADENLRAENIPANRIRTVGNLMIDALHAGLTRAEQSSIKDDLGIAAGAEYVVLTLHRPSNVDDRFVLSDLLDTIAAIGEQLPVIFPAHPRTRARLAEFNLLEKLGRHPALRVVEPLGYLDFLKLMSGARLVLTDSGGLQEETTALGIPCLTLRENTERPITVTVGTNRVVGTKRDAIVAAVAEVLRTKSGGTKAIAVVPPLWDGRAAERVLDALLEWRDEKY